MKTWLAQWTGSAFIFGIARTAWRTGRSSIHTRKLWNTESDSMPLSLTALDEHDLPFIEETPTHQYNGHATKWSSPAPSAQSRPRKGRQVAATWKLGHLSFCFQHIPSGLWIWQIIFQLDCSRATWALWLANHVQYVCIYVYIYIYTHIHNIVVFMLICYISTRT